MAVPGTSGPLAALESLARRVGRLMRQNLRTLVAAVAAIVFLGLLEDVAEGEVMKLDTMAYQLFVVRMRSDALTPVMEGLSALASPVTVLVMALVVAAFAPGRAPGRCVVLNLVCVIVLNQLLKFIVQRPRPDGFRLVAESGYSFPSGHSMFAMGFFGLLAWMVWRYEKDRGERYLWSICFSLIAVLVGLSRIYLGVHYASDVVAGFCVSLAWLAFYTHTVAPAMLESEDASGEKTVG